MSYGLRELRQQQRTAPRVRHAGADRSAARMVDVGGQSGEYV
jgi:hypothetical protein